MKSTLTFWISISTLCIGIAVSQADDIILPKSGQWGDAQSTAESLLKMNHDPVALRHDEANPPGLHVQGSCTDSQGHVFQGEDAEYITCMNEKLKKSAPHAEVHN